MLIEEDLDLRVMPGDGARQCQMTAGIFEATSDEFMEEFESFPFRIESARQLYQLSSSECLAALCVSKLIMGRCNVGSVVLWDLVRGTCCVARDCRWNPGLPGVLLWRRPLLLGPSGSR
jgi:hypothetical protein